jgi:hypothetical protein
MARRRQAGRIRPYERDADDSTAILGASIPVQDVHSQEVRNTEQRGLDLKTERNYRNRIQEIYTFFKSHYPDYYTVGVRQLSEEEWTDPDSFYWKNLYDQISSIPMTFPFSLICASAPNHDDIFQCFPLRPLARDRL